MRFNEIAIDKVRTNSYENRVIHISMNEVENPIRFQIPSLFLPFGISSFTPPMGQTKWSMDLNLHNYDDESSYIGKFYKFVRELENIVINSVTEQSSKIFGKPMDKEEIAKIFNSNIKENQGYDPKFRIKYLPTHTDVFDCDGNDSNIELRDGVLMRHSATCLVEIPNIWFMNKMFGIT